MYKFCRFSNKRLTYLSAISFSDLLTAFAIRISDQRSVGATGHRVAFKMMADWKNRAGVSRRQPTAISKLPDV
jgi:hypothetical protein